jgi:hypothetical protein
MIQRKVILYVSIGLILTGSSLAQNNYQPIFNRSDVAIKNHPDLVFRWDIYNPTMLTWGRDIAYPWGNGEAEAQTDIEAAIENDLWLISTNVDFITATAYEMYFDTTLQETAVRDVTGEKMLVSWFSDRYYEGVPTYWNCTNHPYYREHIITKVSKGIGYGANAVHFDDARGSGRLEIGGCFCDYCIAGFREYLRENYSEAELQAMGIDTLETYNYREEVHQICPTKDDFINTFRNSPEEIPLIDDYAYFHFRAVSEFIGELDSLAEDIAGKAVYTSINAYNLTPNRIVAMDYIDFFSTEMNQRNHNGGDAVFVFKFADALNMSAALMGDAYDWGYIQSTGADNLVKFWMARTYAFGHHHTAPHKQWVFINGVQQSSTYSGPTDEFRTVFDFIRRYAHVFDGYEAVGQIGLLSSNESLRNGSTTVYSIAGKLYENNFPFGIVIAGDKWVDHPLTEDKLAPYEKIIIQYNAVLDSNQQTLVETFRQEGKVVEYYNWTLASQQLPSSWVSLEGNPPVSIVPRIKPNDPDATLVIHLLNRDFDVANNQMREKTNLNLHIAQLLLEGRTITAASILHYEGENQSLTFKSDTTGITITIPTLDMWGILLLGTELTTPVQSEESSLMEFALYQNYPNPFNPKTIINYELPITNDVELTIYNLLGQKVVILVSGKQKAGHHHVEWDASGFPSGVYFYRIKAGSYTGIKKMLLVK